MGAAAIEVLVERAAIEPHAAAARAVVDLDAAALGHDQGLVVHRTFHGRHSSVPTGILVFPIWGLMRPPPPFAFRRPGVMLAAGPSAELQDHDSHSERRDYRRNPAPPPPPLHLSPPQPNP